MKSVCVFCASSPGENPDLMATARAVGATLAQQNIKVIYGGARVGLMGAVADGALAAGGSVTGVLPKFLSTKEVAHAALTELILVETMHERKMKMFELAEGFLALPGGFGTLEEVSEVLTWQQLGLHKFPIGFLNVGGFYDPLLSFFNQMELAKLLRPDNRTMALDAKTLPELLEKMRSYVAPEAPAWLRKSES